MVMIKLRPKRYATEKAHKLHPRATGPFRVRRKINPNAYDIAILPDWGIPTTFNICDLVAYQGPLEVPTEPGLPPDSTEPSPLELEENDGPHTPTSGVTANDLERRTEPGDLAGTKWEEEATRERAGRPRRSAKPTVRSSEYYYF